ncbi:type II toxin-antitoxin system VapC family toxin [Cellulomonas sp. S1-8]|uniref:type II toxin-antitoxin system VapC family toxin n=1 Tax=Cellulomonas sp. S1-8 TaxID=2904790 RepID=UPI0022440A91|nr:type II toxin-antitoxin system VapC family toxin [Cellulomonas sp. S1-8]UZN03934.1 type II toxin-antitoxin system VapC family toxin [Cellulomonas sp. S1-8]
MIVDTSAVVAILLGEPGADELVRSVLADPRPRMSAPTFVELSAVVAQKGAPQQRRRVESLLERLGIEVVAMTPEHARIAADAYRELGRGSGHPARLNLGDCFSYALATEQDEPLLFVGDDFSHTDLRPARARD